MKLHICLAWVTILLASTPLHAQNGSGNPVFTDDWLFRLGGQQADANAKVGLANSNLGEIPIIDLDASGADTRLTSFFANVMWQAPERLSIGFSYYQARVESDRVLDEDFQFGDLTIPEGTGARTDFTTDFYVLNGFWDVYQSSSTSVGLGLGLYGLDLDISIASQVGNQPTGEVESADTLAPLPTISAYFKHAFNDHLAVFVDGGWLSANIDEYDGEVLAGRVSLDYWFNDNWGLGAGYNYVDIDVLADKPVFDQYYQVQYNSMFFYAMFGF